MAQRIHLIAPPNVQTTAAYALDGFSQYTIRFARILKSLGHTVLLYASEENEAPCDELIPIISKHEQQELLGSVPYQAVSISATHPLWILSNQRTILEIGARKQPRDLICLIGGLAQQTIAAAHPTLMCVEYSIGYIGSFSPYRVFQSQAWMHMTYGRQGIGNGRFFDTVIPGFFDPADFPFQSVKEPFALYVGRLTNDKGITVACQAAKAAGLPLKVIGHGARSLVTDGAEYLGALSTWDRNQWMSRAQAVICPTLYVEPFNNVAVEAQFCGTPVVSSDFGGFTETVEHRKTGYRCSYLGEFAQALHAAAGLDQEYIRRRAERLYSLSAVAPLYQRYFERLALLWTDGWASKSVGQIPVIHDRKSA